MSSVKSIPQPDIKSIISRNAIDLFLISFLALFFEMICIRWIPSNVRIMAYFTNIILISSFLGLGIGVAIAKKRGRMITYFPFLLFCLVFLVTFYMLLGIMPAVSSREDFLWNFISRVQHGPLSYIALVVLYILNTVIFIPLGKIMGEYMSLFQPIKAYSINIVGGLAGVLFFSMISYLRLSPTYWFGIGLLTTAWFLSKRDVYSMKFWLSFVLIIAFVNVPILGGDVFWSPYYMIHMNPIELEFDDGSMRDVGFNLYVNLDSHQQTLDLAENLEGSDYIESKRKMYDLPYVFNKPHDVLVVGAGTGNDVAAALRADASKIDAVEIDPVILDIGKKTHPEEPYQDMRVRLYVDDARSFLRKTNRTYDVINFGFLDSHTLFSSMSSVRLDNYMYTMESFNEVKGHLNEKGVVAITFTVHERWIADRLYHMLEKTFGVSPVVYQGDKNAWGTVFLVGEGLQGKKLENILDVVEMKKDDSWTYLENFSGLVSNDVFDENIFLPTDDWPYLYMKEKRIPSNYLKVLALLFIISATMVWATIPKATKIDWHFFFLGGAFMLLETKSITELALLYGSTWIVNSVVIAAILVMILLANLYVLKWKGWRTEYYYAILFAVLVLNYNTNVSDLIKQNFIVELVLSSTLIALPLLFAGIIFAKSFKKTKNIPIAFGSNLIGAVLGGLMEYSSLAYGLKSLYILAAVMYLLSLISIRYIR